jgi:hypothetical protein
MEEETILRITFLITIIFFVVTSCGIKGSPLPPLADKDQSPRVPLVVLKN